MEKGIRMEPLYKGRGDIVSPANIDKGLFTRHPHAPQTSKEKKKDAPPMNQKEKLTFTQHSTLRCGHNLRCCNSHVKRPEKENNNNQIVPFPFYLGSFWYRRSSGGEEFRGRRVQLWRVSAHLSMTHGHLKFINSPLCKFFLIESSRHMPDYSIRFDSILLLAFFSRRLDTFPILYSVTKFGPFL